MEYEKAKSADVLIVTGHRGAVSHEKKCVLLQMKVEKQDLQHQEQMLFALTPEAATGVIQSLQTALAAFRQSN